MTEPAIVSPPVPAETAPRRRVAMIYNPAAGWHGPRRLKPFTQAVEALGCAVEMLPTQGPGDATRIAGELDHERCDAVVVAGGDGTINETLNGLAADAPPLGIIPMGTANVLAAELGLPGRPAELARLIVHGPSRTIQLGQLTGPALPQPRRFVMMAGVGFDAQVVAMVDTRLKRRIGKGAYWWTSLDLLARWQGVRYSVRIDGQEWEVASVIVANGHFYGGRFVCAPEACLQDDLLHVCLFFRHGHLAIGRYGFALVTGGLAGLPESWYRIVPARKLDISVHGGVGGEVQGDGDIIGHLPGTLEMCPHRTPLLMP